MAELITYHMLDSESNFSLEMDFVFGTYGTLTNINHELKTKGIFTKEMYRGYRDKLEDIKDRAYRVKALYYENKGNYAMRRFCFGIAISLRASLVMIDKDMVTRYKPSDIKGICKPF